MRSEGGKNPRGGGRKDGKAFYPPIRKKGAREHAQKTIKKKQAKECVGLKKLSLESKSKWHQFHAGRDDGAKEKLGLDKFPERGRRWPHNCFKGSRRGASSHDLLIQAMA